MGSVPAPHDRRGFEIAVICALPLEAECVQEVFDKFWEDEGKRYGKAAGDPNVYTPGVIGDHNVVLAYMPGMGTTSAAAVAGAMRVSFSNIKLALVVGICGGMPYDASGNEILLGDVIISQALIQYDFGRQYPEGFRRKTGMQDTLGRPSPEIRAIQAKLGTSRYRQRMQKDIATFLEDLEKKLPKTKAPARENDVLYHSSYVHQHHPPEACECSEEDQICVKALQTNCEDLGCETVKRVTRHRLGNAMTEPIVHFGVTGSGNTVMKSGRHRDQVAKVDGIIAFEMEGAGVWDYFPSIVIKGVCDYADSHKRKGWQRYAAATAASCMKAFLMEWAPRERSSSPVNEINAKTYFVIPVQRVKDFIGRQEELRQIRAYFHERIDRPRVLVLHAMGGQGKSQIALEYCQQQRKQYRGIFWINSSSKSTLTQAIVSIGREINIAATEALGDDDAKIAFTVRTLEQWEERWLMVFDNCDDPATFSDIEQFIPQGGRGDVLFTSRHGGLRELGRIIDIPPLPDKAGVELLLHRYIGIDVNQYLSEGSTIVRRLGGLALAIDQASAYMTYQQLPVYRLGDFLARFEAERKKVLQHTAEHFWRYMKIDDENGRGKAINAFTTWEMSFQQLLSDWDPPQAVEHFLTLAAFLGPAQVNESLFKFHRELEYPPPDWCDIFTPSCRSDDDSSSSDAEEEVDRQEQVTRDQPAEAHKTAPEGSKKMWDAENFWRLLRQAHQMSLLQDILPSTPSEGASFVLHPLIRDWLQLRLRSKERQTYTREGVDVVVSSIRTYQNRVSDATIKRSILLHMDATLLTVRDLFKNGARLGQDITSCNNADWFASFYRDQGHFDASLDLYRTVIMTRKRVQGKEHPSTLTSMNNLAAVLSDQGKYEAAEQMHREVVEVRERVLGKEHPETLTSMNNLAGVLSDQGKYEAAEQMHREVVEVRERALGKEHLSTLTSMNNLALVLSDQGKYEAAE
ncbi:hypothetical protein AYL99_09002 [Fonsecaea erecta]|uniref:Uncharacterized protein n=1 Tax=Fonsecaea erecta TaxID=1367422 RepID=A0A178ZAT3_9EURO|nr:hypothetical protein AYL99_09002 [Fonsecaea erecta]OAP56890.1 hypothetical protein AYL99_09002 [Fonsecaea erecta]